MACLGELIRLGHARDSGDLGHVCGADGQDNGAGVPSDLVGCDGEEVLAVDGNALDFTVVEVLKGFVANKIRAQSIPSGDVLAVIFEE